MKYIKSFDHRYILSFLQPGRLIKVTHNDDEWGWGVVVNFQKKGKQNGKNQFRHIFQFLKLYHLIIDIVI